ncbi:MAG: hypothetical protein ABSF98_15310 [Bryobacteraceae bacterium]|jgi:hypothetical protein
MDIYKAIHELIVEKKRIDAVIASLEARSNGGVREKSRRGRKSMDPDERAAVSRRMAAYWAARRGQPAGPAEPAEMTALAAEMPPPLQFTLPASSGFEAAAS